MYVITNEDADQVFHALAHQTRCGITEVMKTVSAVQANSTNKIRRKKQFALITPATKIRIGPDLALKGEEPSGRLESYNAMYSHRVRLESVPDLNKEVKDWMKEAYDRAG